MVIQNLKITTVGTTERYAYGRTKITEFIKINSVSSIEGRSHKSLDLW